MNNDIPSVITEAVLSCLYSNKRTVSGVVDEVKLSAVFHQDERINREPVRFRITIEH